MHRHRVAVIPVRLDNEKTIKKTQENTLIRFNYLRLCVAAIIKSFAMTYFDDNPEKNFHFIGEKILLIYL